MTPVGINVGMEALIFQQNRSRPKRAAERKERHKIAHKAIRNRNCHTSVTPVMQGIIPRPTFIGKVPPPMRTLVSALLAASLLATTPLAITPAAAQSMQDQFEVGFQQREAQRRASIAGAMRFNDEEAAAFWPIYDQYRLATKALQLRRLTMFKTLSENVVGMDDETAESLVKSGLAAEAEANELKQSYLKEAGDVISGPRYVRLFQVEMKLDAMLIYGVTQQIPLAVTEEERKILEDRAAAKAEAERQNASATPPTT